MYNYSKPIPYYFNMLRQRKPLSSTLLSSSATKSITTLITNAQKIISIYDRALPIINQSKPMIDNIKTTFKVAKAFKRFSNESSLEKAFDILPDYKEEIKETKSAIKVTNPFYPWYTIGGDIMDVKLIQPYGFCLGVQYVVEQLNRWNYENWDKA